MRKFKFAKLVRDKIVDQIVSNGNKPNWRVLSDEDYIKELKNKILEEASEISKSEDSEDLVKELADVQEIVDNLLDTLKVSKKQFKEIQNKKNKKAGSFKKRLYIEYVETTDDEGEWTKYNLAHPDKYPEIK